MSHGDAQTNATASEAAVVMTGPSGTGDHVQASSTCANDNGDDDGTCSTAECNATGGSAMIRPTALGIATAASSDLSGAAGLTQHRTQAASEAAALHNEATTATAEAAVAADAAVAAAAADAAAAVAPIDFTICQRCGTVQQWNYCRACDSVQCYRCVEHQQCNHCTSLICVGCWQQHQELCEDAPHNAGVRDLDEVHEISSNDSYDDAPTTPLGHRNLGTGFNRGEGGTTSDHDGGEVVISDGEGSELNNKSQADDCNKKVDVEDDLASKRFWDELCPVVTASDVKSPPPWSGPCGTDGGEGAPGSSINGENFTAAATSNSGPPPTATHFEGGGHSVKRISTDTLHPPTVKRRVTGKRGHEGSI